MSRYLKFALEGEPPAKEIRAIQHLASVSSSGGRTTVRIDGLPLPELPDILRRISEIGLRRSNNFFDLGPMPKHKDPPNETFVAYQIEADDVDLPANPPTDFEKSIAQFKSCSWVKPGIALQVFRKPKGHMAGIGRERIVDDTLADFIKEIAPKIAFGEVTWKGSIIPWRRLERVPDRFNLLDWRLAVNPPVACRVCGFPLRSLRSTLVARPDVKLIARQFVANREACGHDDREPVYLLSPEAAREWTKTHRSGCVLTPVHAHNSPAAQYLMEVENLLNEHLPPQA